MLQNNPAINLIKRRKNTMIKKKNKDLRADWMPDQVGYDIGARRHCEE